MRLLPSFLLTTLTLGLIYLDNPEPLRAALDSTARQFSSALTEKRLTFSGLRSVSEQELLKSLPMERSVIWWRMNDQAIESTLKRHSLVRDAAVESCATMAIKDWGCFTVTISERVPYYAAVLDFQVWILGEDGGFLFPITKQEFENEPMGSVLSRKMGRPIAVTKPLMRLYVRGDTPELLEARLKYLRGAVDIIEEQSGLSAESARCTVQGEVRIRFNGYPFEAIFDYAENEPEKLRKEGRRLKRLVTEFGSKLSNLELIDLAYNKLAVVRFQPTPAPTRAPR